MQAMLARDIAYELAGFTVDRNRGTYDRITNIVSIWEKGRQTYFCIIGFIKAFKMVRLDQLCLTMPGMDFPPKMTQLEQALYS